MRCAYLVKHDCPVIGINCELGLTDVSPDDELVAHVTSVLDGNYATDKRSLLDVEVYSDGAQTGQAEALNDVVVNSGTSAQMIEFQLQVDDEFVYRMNADGLIIATPTGSTAYSMSAGGPIMNQGSMRLPVPMFLVRTSRPMVVHGERRIDTLERNKNNPLVTCDGQVSLTLKPGDSVLVRKSRATSAPSTGVQFLCQLSR